MDTPSTLTTAIMQPYFLPYVGYFQLIQSADLFIVYDNIKYTKKGWINRNRMLVEGRDVVFSLPLKHDSDSLDVRDRQISSEYDQRKLLNRMTAAYRRAPQFAQVLPLIEEVLQWPDRNLYGFLLHSIGEVCRYLGITTEIRRSSDVAADHTLAGQERVLALCGAVGTDAYHNPIGGVELYSKEAFAARGIALKFLKSSHFEYRQLGAEFVPWLSIVDVLMFNPSETVQQVIRSGYDLI